MCLQSSHACTLVGDSVAENPEVSRSVDSVGLPVAFLSLWVPQSSPLLFHKGPELSPMFGCGFLHILVSCSVEPLIYARLLSARITVSSIGLPRLTIIEACSTASAILNTVVMEMVQNAKSIQFTFQYFQANKCWSKVLQCV